MKTEIIISYRIEDAELIPHDELYTFQDNIENYIRESWSHGMREGSFTEVVEYTGSPLDIAGWLPRKVSREFVVYWSINYKHGE
jgi:hypothetical protein